MNPPPLIGISIATFNSGHVLQSCLTSLAESKYLNLHICIVDSGSTDGSVEQLCRDFSARLDLEIIRVNSDHWWTAATNRGIEECLNIGCDYIFLLNPDVIIESTTIINLLQLAKISPHAIIGSVVVNDDDPKQVWWAGSQWKPLYRFLPLLWSSQYIVKRGASLTSLPDSPYLVSEAHGRAVLVPREIFDSIGLYDTANFPHYGADTDFSFRAIRHGFSILIDPKTIVRLQTENTGLKHTNSLHGAWRGYLNYLMKRKNGEAIKVWWRLTQRHLPPVKGLTTFLFIIALNSFRYWSAALRHLK